MQEQLEHVRQAFAELAKQGVIKLAIVEAPEGECGVLIRPRSGLSNEPQIRDNCPLVGENGMGRQYRIYASSRELAHLWTHYADLAAESITATRGWLGWADRLVDHAQPVRWTWEGITRWHAPSDARRWFALVNHVAWKSSELAQSLAIPETDSERQARLYDKWHGRTEKITSAQFAERNNMEHDAFLRLLDRERQERKKEGKWKGK